MKTARALAVLLAAVLGMAGPAQAAGPGLDAARRAVLLEAPVLHGPAPAAATLDGRVVVVATWASWCLSCHLEMARLKAAYARYGPEKLTVLAVNLFEEYGRAPDGRERDLFVRRHDPPFAMLQGGPDFVSAFGPVGVPRVFVLGPDGREVPLPPDAPGTDLSALEGSGLEMAIERLLGAPAS